MTKTIIIRGCTIKVKGTKAEIRELENIEKELMFKDWNNNRVD